MLDAVADNEGTYRAFLSYSRRNDKEADWLHRQIDRYRTPNALIGTHGTSGIVPERLHPVFRDRTDLAAGGHLSSSIAAALSKSERLVVLCSKESANSEWVELEVSQFLATHGTDKIFLVISAYETGVRNVEDELYPPCLRGLGILATDLREEELQSGEIVGDGRAIGRLKLIAGLLGVELDQLVKRDERRRRSLIAGLSIALVVFALVSVVAIYSTLTANERRLEAAKNLESSRITQSRFLSDLSREAAELGSPTDALALALEATPRDRSDWPYVKAAEQALYRSAMAHSLSELRTKKKFHGHEQAVLGVRFDSKLGQLITWSADWSARIWDTETGEQLLRTEHEGPVLGAKIISSGEEFLTWSYDGRVTVWSLPGGESLRSYKHDNGLTDLKLMVKEGLVLSYSPQGEIQVRGIEDFALVAEFAVPYLANAQLVDAGRAVLAWTRDGVVELLRVSEEARAFRTRLENPIKQSMLDIDNGRLWLITDRVDYIDLLDLQLRTFFEPESDQDVSSVNWNKDASIVSITGDDNRTEFFDSSSGQKVGEIESEIEVVGISFAKETERAVLGFADGTIQTWDLSTFELVRLDQISGTLVALQYNLNESIVTAWDAEGRVFFADANSGKRLSQIRHESRVNGVSSSPSEGLLITYSADGEMHLLESISSSPYGRIGNRVDGGSILVSKDDSKVLECGPGQTLSLLSLADGEVLSSWLPNDSIEHCLWTEDESTVFVYSGNGRITGYQTNEHNAYFEITVEPPLRRWAASASGSRLLVGDESGNYRLWDTVANQLKTAWEARPQTWAVYSSVKSDKLIMETLDGIEIVDWNGLPLMEPISGNSTKLHNVASDYSILAVIKDATILNLWDLDKGQIICSIDAQSEVLRANISSDGEKAIFRTSDGSAFVLNLETAKKTGRCKEHAELGSDKAQAPSEQTARIADEASITGVQLSSRSDLFATSSRSNGVADTVKLWKAPGEPAIFESEELFGDVRFWFAETDPWFVISSRTRLIVLELESFEVVFDVQHRDGINPIHPMQSSNRVLAVTDLGMLLVFDFASGELLVEHPLQIEKMVIRNSSDIRYSPGRNFLYARYGKTIIPYWDAIEQLEAFAHSVVQDVSPLSEREACRAYLLTECPTAYSSLLQREIARSGKMMEGQVGNLVDLVYGASDKHPLDVEVAALEDSSIVLFHSLPFNGNVKHVEYYQREGRLSIVMENGQQRGFGMRLHPVVARYVNAASSISLVHTILDVESLPASEIFDDRFIEARNGKMYINSQYTVPLLTY